jgi:hypothetical protein
MYSVRNENFGNVKGSITGAGAKQTKDEADFIARQVEQHTIYREDPYIMFQGLPKKWFDPESMSRPVYRGRYDCGGRGAYGGGPMEGNIDSGSKFWVNSL